MNEVIGRLLETARQDFIRRHEDFYKFSMSNGRGSLEYWLEDRDIDPIGYSVRYAAAENFIDNPEILNTVRQSLKFRVLAGILTRPIDYEGSDEIKGGMCGNLEFDEEVGGWVCKVPGDQQRADNWHSNHGNSSACPFWVNPQSVSPFERKETEIENMLEEGTDLETAWHQLGLRNKR